jgi:opacity protein-like surface antigen
VPKYLLPAALLLLLPGPTLAQADSGLYLEADLGYSAPQSLDLEEDELEGEADLEDTYVIGGALGYRFPSFRVEANLSYRESDAEELSIEGVDFDGDGEASALVGLVNAYYDLDLGLPLRPYIGGGVGAAYLRLDTGDAPVDVDDDTGALAWNLAAGVGYDVTESVTLTAGYRYLRLEGTDVSGDVIGFDGDVDIDDIELHEVLLGVRYTF